MPTSLVSLEILSVGDFQNGNLTQKLLLIGKILENLAFNAFAGCNEETFFLRTWGSEFMDATWTLIFVHSLIIGKIQKQNDWRESISKSNETGRKELY